jgi:hypothetical protein
LKVKKKTKKLIKAHKFIFYFIIIIIDFAESPGTLIESPAAKSPGPSTFPLSQKKLRSIFRTAMFTNSLSNERNWKHVHQGPEHLKDNPFPLIGSAVSVPQFWFNLYKGKHSVSCFPDLNTKNINFINF